MLIVTFIFNSVAHGATDPGCGSTEPADEVVVVTGDGAPSVQGDAVIAADVIDRAAIARSGAATLDQLLEMQAGVQLLQGLRGPTVSLRGHAPEHTLVLVDGRRTIGRVGGGLDLRRFPVDRIERVEIVRGPTSALYGADALGGVIHIVTRDAKSPWQADATLTAGGYAGAAPLDDRAVVASAAGATAGLDQLGVDLNVGGKAKKWAAWASLSALGLDGWDRDPVTAATDGDQQRLIAPSARLTFGDGAASLSVDGLVVEGRGVDAAAATLDRLQRTSTWDVSLDGRVAAPRGVTVQGRLDGSVYRDDLRQDQRGSDALDSFERTTEVLGRAWVQADGFADGGQRHHLLGGGEVMLEGATAARIEGGGASRSRGGVWLQHRWRAVDAVGLALLTGMRLDLDSRFGVAPAPRVAVRLVPHDRLTLRVAGGLGYRAPDFKQLFLSFSNPAAGYRVAGNPDLEPERSVGGNVDVELRAHRDLTLTVSAWHDAVRGLITTDLVAEGGGEAVYGYVNVGRARLQGLAAALYVAPARPVSLALTYTLTDADDLERQRPLPGRAEHQGGASLRGAHEALAFGGSVSAVVLGPRPFYPGDGLNGAVVHPTTAFLDARAWWRPTAAVELFVGVDNLLDAGVPDLDAARPRRAYGGLTVRLRPPDREAVRPTPIAGVR